jgi:predicted transcriptional regulator
MYFRYRMRVTKVQAFILFALGTCYAEFSRRFAGKPVAVSMNKVAFIELARRANITSKKERAVYKNLEALEALKLVSYDSKNLALTPKGQKVFERVHADLEPYINIKGVLAGDDIAKFTTRTQTILKGD